MNRLIIAAVSFVLGMWMMALLSGRAHSQEAPPDTKRIEHERATAAPFLMQEISDKTGAWAVCMGKEQETQRALNEARVEIVDLRRKIDELKK